jgi:hypothetical protein
MDNELVLHPHGSRIIYMTCFYQLAPIYYGIYYKVYDSSIITTIVFSTSINYWRNPIKNSIRRYIDISSVIIGVFYHLYLIYFYSLSIKYYLMIGIGSILYPVQYRIPTDNYYLISMSHSLLQVIACKICIQVCNDIYNIINNTNIHI